MQGVQVTIDNTNRLYCRWFKLPPTIQTVCIVIDNTNRLYCSWLAIQTVCIVVGLQYKLFVLSAPQYKPFVLSSMQYKLFVLQLRATIQTVCIAGGSSYHTCNYAPLYVNYDLYFIVQPGNRSYEIRAGISSMQQNHLPGSMSQVNSEKILSAFCPQWDLFAPKSKILGAKSAPV